VQLFSGGRYGPAVNVAPPPSPPLSDGVVTLRPWTARDVPAITAACADDEIARWLDQIPQPYTELDARAYVTMVRQGWRDGSQYVSAIVDAEMGEVLGSIGVRALTVLDEGTAEVGYWVKREARGRGVASRALRLVSDWTLRELGFGRLQLRADERNVPSQRVAVNVGFTREGVLRASRFNARQNRRVDFVMYSLLPGELG
jgi:RimJ/RimL family protein N-acetyltransferase